MNNNLYSNLKTYLSEIIKALVYIKPELISLYENQQNLKIETKADLSPVTEADLLVNNHLLKFFQKYKHSILSEESNLEIRNNEYLWIIDPIDGTKDFLQQTGEFSILIALNYKNETVLAITYLPTKDEFYWAIKNNGAYLQVNKQKPKKITVSNTTSIDVARTIVSKNHFSERMLATIENLNLKNVIRCGSNGVKLAKLAHGEAEIFFNTSNKLKMWDLCGPALIVKEAGGKITDLKGNELDLNENKIVDGVIATNGSNHKEIVDYFINKEKNV